MVKIYFFNIVLWFSLFLKASGKSPNSSRDPQIFSTTTFSPLLRLPFTVVRNRRSATSMNRQHRHSFNLHQWRWDQLDVRSHLTFSQLSSQMTITTTIPPSSRLASDRIPILLLRLFRSMTPQALPEFARRRRKRRSIGELQSIPRFLNFPSRTRS